MTEQELRNMVRSVIAQHAGHSSAVPPDPSVIPLVGVRPHASHAQFSLEGSPDGRCLIEPAVACNHCGYCRSYGH